ncbi:MAG TPA: DUF503 domain-containing protein [Acidimicrobiales bacterium]|nr:DUF503 domain-containing protein [Acidimicrobiales bacterium]
MEVCALTVELHLAGSRSLKDKRAVVRHLLDTARRRFGVAAAEVGHLDRWQRAELGFAAVGATVSHVEEVLDTVERFIWSNPEVEVVSTARGWLEVED